MDGDRFADALEQARRGDPAGFSALYRWLAPAVAGYLRVQGADADELTNEVFAGVFRRLGGFEGGSDRFRAWVFTVAHSRLVDARRRAGRRPVEDLFEPGSLAGGASPSAEDDALRHLAEARVRAMCARLAPDQRDVLLLRMIGDLSVEQCAAALGKSQGAVKALQRRGLAALRRILEREGVPR